MDAFAPHLICLRCPCPWSGDEALTLADGGAELLSRSFSGLPLDEEDDAALRSSDSLQVGRPKNDVPLGDISMAVPRPVW